MCMGIIVYRDNYINASAWVLRCSFYWTGQCESLGVWDGRQARISTLFLYSNVMYLFRRCLEVAEAFKIFKTMEKKNRNEELQSRREFFKKAAKGVLPILGATLLANTPLLVKATEEDPMGCNYSCSYSCSNSCRGNCAGGCKGGCGGACSYSCQNTCKGSCEGSCRGGCSSMSSY